MGYAAVGENGFLATDVGGLPRSVEGMFNSAQMIVVDTGTTETLNEVEIINTQVASSFYGVAVGNNGTILVAGAGTAPNGVDLSTWVDKSNLYSGSEDLLAIQKIKGGYENAFLITGKNGTILSYNMDTDVLTDVSPSGYDNIDFNGISNGACMDANFTAGTPPYALSLTGLDARGWVYIVGTDSTIIYAEENNISDIDANTTWVNATKDFSGNCYAFNSVYVAWDNVDITDSIGDNRVIIVGNDGIIVAKNLGGNFAITPLLDIDGEVLSTNNNLNYVEGSIFDANKLAVNIVGDGGYIQYNDNGGLFFGAAPTPVVGQFITFAGTDNLNAASFDDGVEIAYVGDNYNIWVGNRTTASFPPADSRATTFSTATGFNAGVLNYSAKIEIYKPRDVQGDIIYYEYGDVYDIGSNTSHSKGAEDDGDVFLIKKDFRGQIWNNARTSNEEWSVLGELIFSMTPDSVDTSNTWEKDIFRPNVVAREEPKEQRLGTLIRYSNNFIEDSNVNGLSSFNAFNQEDLPNTYGQINKLVFSDNILLALCDREASTMYIDEVVFESNENNQFVGKSDGVIQNVRKLKGQYGCQNPESVFDYNGWVYWNSRNKGSVVRYNDANGAFPISTYKMRNYFFNKNMDVNDTYVIGGYDPRFKSYYITFLSGDQETVRYIDRFRDNAAYNRWVSFYSFIPDCYAYVDTDMHTFKDGVLYRNNSNETRNNFFGVQGSTEVTTIFNNAPSTQKVFNNFMLESEGEWDAPEITTPKGQTSLLQVNHGERINNELWFDILRDTSTPNAASTFDALWNGLVVADSVITSKFRTEDTTKARLYASNCYSQINMRTDLS